MRRTLYDEEHEAFRATVRALLDRCVTPRHAEFIRDRGIPRDVWIEAGKQGILGLEVPASLGGVEASDYRFNAVVLEELAAISAALASSLSIHFDVVAPYLVDLTTGEARERWFPAFCTGEIVTAIAMTEPSAGSDLAALRTTAVKDGDSWVVNGSKTFITNGTSADLVIVAARTTPGAGARGITLFGVDAAWDGFQRGRKLDKVGQHEADTSELFFQDLRVPDWARLGDVDRGFAHMMERLPQERIGAAVTNLAHARGVLDETLAYTRERQAFGQAIGSFQHNKFLLADLVTRVEVTQSYVDDCIRSMASGELTATDAAKAKWWSAEVQNDVIDACVQLHGGYGYMTEYRTAQAWMDARVTKIWAGSNEIMKELIGRDLGL